MTFSFENLFVVLWGVHRAEIGQRNGMIVCMSGIRAPCHWNFFLVKKIHDSIPEFASHIANLPAERWVRRTLAWKPRPTYPPRGQNWDAKIGNVLQVQGCVQMGNCCEKCGPMGLSFAVFPGFELHVVISSTFSERCLYLVQFWHFWLYVFLFSASAVTLGSPALELTRAFMYYGSDKYICRPGWPNSQGGNGNQVVVV